jgi:hypothetical protein
MKRANAVDITGDADTVDGLHASELDEKILATGLMDF